MIEKIARKMAFRYSAQSEMRDVLVQEYYYGFQLLLSTVINGVLIFLISLLLHVFIESIVFSITFISFRVTAGGYHAKSHKACIFLVCTVYTVVATLILLLPQFLLMPYAFFCAILSSMIVWIYAPVETGNKALGMKQKERLRNQSIIISSVILFFVILSHYIPVLPPKLVAFGMSGALAASASALIAEITKKKEDEKNGKNSFSD